MSAAPGHRFMLNGRIVTSRAAGVARLADILRDEFGVTGVKIGCNAGDCGACTVLLDGRAVFACHTLAAQVDGVAVETIEGLAAGDDLHPLQAAFITHDALQCGFCTPGIIMALKAAVDSGVSADRAALAAAIAGNLCRCGAYEHIVDAALSVVTG